jgi:pimeloyl-ACP methyl ester carboxylesterase
MAGLSARVSSTRLRVGSGRTEKVFAEINGARLGMFVQSENPALPVLLYLHGGMPEFFLTGRYPTGLDRDFTVVWLEQRGAGLSYHPDVPPALITSEQLIDDTLAVACYLRERFGTKKIYLMAHSGGTFIGLQAVARDPGLFAAYVGVAQMVRQLESEMLAQQHMLARCRQAGDRRLARRLEAAPVTMANGTPRAYLAVRDRAMHRLGVGTTRDMRSVISGVFWPSLRTGVYTPAEKLRLWQGKRASGVSVLWDEMMAADLREQVTELAVPAYFFHGAYDYTVSYPLAKAFFHKLKAPVKGFYTFAQSAHSPVFEEPERACEIMRHDVLAGSVSMADTPR